MEVGWAGEVLLIPLWLQLFFLHCLTLFRTGIPLEENSCKGLLSRIASIGHRLSGLPSSMASTPDGQALMKFYVFVYCLFGSSSAELGVQGRCQSIARLNDARLE